MRPLKLLLTTLFVLPLAAAGAAQVAGAEPAASQSGAREAVVEKPAFQAVARVKSPTALTSAPGLKKAIFLTERQGLVRVIVRGQLMAKPFLDIRDRVLTDWVEQGLLGIAFAPDYLRTRRFYVFYTGLDGDIRIDEFQRAKDRPFVAAPASRRAVLRIPRLSDQGNHNGGSMKFVGRNLLITVGDGGDPGDAFRQAQSLGSLRGKILRIDPRADQKSGRGYRVPAANPFVNRAGRDEILALGFRNPHALNVYRDSADVMRAVITDVGQLRFEEVNNVSLSELRAANFGWNIFEGDAPYNCGPELCPNGAVTDPADATVTAVTEGLTWPDFVYSHSEGCAVIGGPVISDPAMGSFKGRLITGDFCRNEIQTFDPSEGLLEDQRPLGAYLPPGRGKSANLNGFGEDGWGRVYALSNFGGVYRLILRQASIPMGER